MIKIEKIKNWIVCTYQTKAGSLYTVTYLSPSVALVELALQNK